MMAKDITAKLVAFAEGWINDPEIVTEIDGLLHGYVEGGLDEDTKLEIAAAIEASQALAAAQRELETNKQQSTGFQTALEQLRLQTGWLRHVASYHLGYAGSLREVRSLLSSSRRLRCSPNGLAIHLALTSPYRTSQMPA